MPKVLNLVSQRFGRLTVISRAGSVRVAMTRHAMSWLCRCDCGREVTVISNNLRSGHTRSCGCLVSEHISKIRPSGPTRLAHIAGHRFGRLVPQHPTPIRSGSSVVWSCLCDCGRTVLRSVSRLRSRETTSCGCVKIEAATTHGETAGGTWTTEYVVWRGVIDRCTNPASPAYERYGGRGIAMCDRWQSFENFLSDMGRRPAGKSLDRIDNNKGYEPANCRWATPTEQNRNKRSNRKLTVNGTTMCIAEWSETTGIDAKRIASRLHSGWTPERSVTFPVSTSRKSPR